MEREGEWFSFSATRFLRKVSVYRDVKWLNSDAPLSQFLHVSAAPFGGPIALTRRINNNAVVTSICSQSGVKIRDITYPTDDGAVHALGWTKEEGLLLVTSKLIVHLFELSGGSGTAALLSPSFTHNMVATGKILPHQKLVAITPGGALSVVENTLCGVMIEERRVPNVVNVTLSPKFEYTALELVAKELTEEDELTVLVGGSPVGSVAGKGNGTIFAVNLSSSSSVTDTKARIPGGVVAMRLCPQNLQLAVLSGRGTLLIMPLSLQEVSFVWQSGVPVVPQSFDWCGSHCVLLTYKNRSIDESGFTDDDAGVSFSIAVCTTSGVDVSAERFSWIEDDGVGWSSITQEVDGVRVLTDNGVWMLEEVSSSLVEVCQLKAASPAAQYASAYRRLKEYDDIEGLTVLRRLVNARRSTFEAEVIETFLDAAMSEYSVDQQEAMLAVAADAKMRFANYDPERYVDVVRRLRVLNALRAPENAIPISIRQYEALCGIEKLRSIAPSEVQVLVDRIVNRRSFQLALNVAATLKLKVHKILTQWSIAQVHDRSMDDSALSERISSVLLRTPGVSFVDAAKAASAVGRHPLAVSLLQHEPRSQQQVLLLLQVAQEDLALQKAFDTDEADLTTLVLAKIVRQRTPNELMNVLQTTPEAPRLLQLGASALGEWRRALYRLWRESQRTYLEGYAALLQCLSKPQQPDDDENFSPPSNSVQTDPMDPSTRQEEAVKPRPMLKQTDLEDIGHLLARSPEVDDRWITQHLSLMEEQRSLCDATGDEQFLRASVIESIRLCFYHNLDASGDALRKKFNIGEKPFIHAKLKALCEAGRWADVDKMFGAGPGVKPKAFKSSIGFLPIVRLLTKYGRLQQAGPFVARLGDICVRAEWYLKLDMYQAAIDDAYNEESPDIIRQIIKKANNPSVIEYANKKLKSLS